ncbi:MAG: glutamyl-tRNA reductase [Alphaproteobacteria bacterium]|nr:glutamyl-tRNA reductase [Alphaproteobacteria bacterium]
MGHPPKHRAAPSDFLVVGASHKTSSTEFRDRLFVEFADEVELFATLRANGFEQAMVVSTCDRVEICGVTRHARDAAIAARSLLGSRLGGTHVEQGAFYVLQGRDAVRHVFAVASSLESAIIGEAEILGQFKDAHLRARLAGALGSELDGLLQKAFSAAKDVRTNTAIAEGPLSLANAALQAVRGLFGDLEKVTALLLGPGEMGVLMLEHFRRYGLRHIVVAGPTPERAGSAAHAFDAHAVTYDSLASALERADLVIGAAGTGHEIVTAEMMRKAIRARRRKPVFILDVAVPADADRAITELDDVFLYDLDDLELVSRSNLAARDAAAKQAWDVVERHVDAFLGANAERDAGQEVSDLRAYFEQVRIDILAESGDMDVAEVTRRLVNRLLHAPSEALRADARTGVGDEAIANAVRRLFALDEEIQSGDGEPPQGSNKHES